MFERCSHQWKETERAHTDPAYVGSASGSPQAIERLLWGITSIVLTCALCGDKKVVEAKGRLAKK